MLLRRAALFAMVLCLAAPSAYGQGMDDLLAPLTPEPAQKSKVKSKGKVRSKSKRTRSKSTRSRSRPSRASKPAPAPAEVDLLAPLVQKTELLVKLGGGVTGARLFIDNQEIGLLPRGAVEVRPGAHSVVVRRAGYRDFSQLVTAAEGEVTEVGVLLDAVVGFVSVTADVPGARVIINGEDKGETPLEGLMLPAGSHEIVLRQEGFRPETQRIAVRAGKEYTVEFSLRPEVVAQADEPRAPKLTPTTTPTAAPAPPLTEEPPAISSSSTPLTQRWYFWAGVGVVVTAAAVGTAVAMQPPPLDPNRDVCGGQCDAIINGPVGAGVVRF